MAQAASRDVDTEPPPHLPDAVHRAARRFLPRLAVASPELVAAAVAGFSLGPMILLLAGAFSAPLAIPLGLLGAAVAVWVCGLPAEPATRRTLLCTAGAALIALAWFAYNVRYYAEDVYATRDPGTYSLAARWLMDHATLNIPRPSRGLRGTAARKQRHCRVPAGGGGRPARAGQSSAACIDVPGRFGLRYHRAAPGERRNQRTGLVRILRPGAADRRRATGDAGP